MTVEKPHATVAALSSEPWVGSHEQWQYVAAGLWDGVTPSAMASACGLELDDLRAGLTVWAAGMARAGELDEDQYTALICTVFGPA